MGKAIKEFFAGIEDSRVEGRCLHKLSDILFIAHWLKTFLELPNGIPSHDTFNRTLQIIDSEQFRRFLKKDAADLLESLEGKLVSFDGKKLKGVSPKSRGNLRLYVLSAWVGENRH